MNSTPLVPEASGDRTRRTPGYTLMTAAAFFSVAADAWLLGTSREARVIEVLSLAAAVVGSVVTAKRRRQTVGRGTYVGYVSFWALAVLATICWTLAAATGTASAA